MLMLLVHSLSFNATSSSVATLCHDSVRFLRARAYVGLPGPNLMLRSTAVGLSPFFEKRNESRKSNAASGWIVEMSVTCPTCFKSVTLPIDVDGRNKPYFIQSVITPT